MNYRPEPGKKYYILAQDSIETWTNIRTYGFEISRAENDLIDTEELLGTFPTKGKVILYNSVEEAEKADPHNSMPGYTRAIFEVTPCQSAYIDAHKAINVSSVQSIDKAWVMGSTYNGFGGQHNFKLHEFNLVPKRADEYEAVFQKNYEGKEHHQDKNYALISMFDKYNFSLWRKHRSMMKGLRQQIQRLSDEDLFQLFLTTIKTLDGSDRNNACFAVLHVALKHLNPKMEEEVKESSEKNTIKP